MASISSNICLKLLALQVSSFMINHNCHVSVNLVQEPYFPNMLMRINYITEIQNVFNHHLKLMDHIHSFYSWICYIHHCSQIPNSDLYYFALVNTMTIIACLSRIVLPNMHMQFVAFNSKDCATCVSNKNYRYPPNKTSNVWSVYESKYQIRRWILLLLQPTSRSLTEQCLWLDVWTASWYRDRLHQILFTLDKTLWMVLTCRLSFKDVENTYIRVL